MKLDSNNYSVFLLYYQLVLVVKYRRKVFSDRMSQYAKGIFVRIEKKIFRKSDVSFERKCFGQKAIACWQQAALP